MAALSNVPPAGVVLTRTLPALSQEAFDEFGALMALDAPIHTDPAYAAGTPFKRTFAQGMLLLSFFEPWLCEIFGRDRWSSNGHLEGKLLNPAFAGDTVTLELALQCHDTGKVLLDLRIRSDEKLIAVGVAGIGADG